MSEIEYLVEPDGANWKVRLQSEDSFPYGTLEEAIEAATEAARGARKCGFSPSTGRLDERLGGKGLERKFFMAHPPSSSRRWNDPPGAGGIMAAQYSADPEPIIMNEDR